jgi:hypothetical protein
VSMNSMNEHLAGDNENNLARPGIFRPSAVEPSEGDSDITHFAGGRSDRCLPLVVFRETISVGYR